MKTKTIVRNQLHKPLKKTNREGAETEMCIMFYKIGACSMPFCRMSKLECECLKANIERYMARKNKKLNGNFIFVRS